MTLKLNHTENKVKTFCPIFSVQYIVIDIELENFFGTIKHEVLVKILQIKIKDSRLMRYIIRILKAGVLANGEMCINEEGVVQGSICSPILANIFAHYVIDQWFENFTKIHYNGEAKLFRYGDDICICCQFENDGIRIKSALANRLNRFKLNLNAKKTKMVNFNRTNARRASFNFLGFTFYWGKSRNGFTIPKVKTDGQRMRSKLQRVNYWAKSVRNQYKLKLIWQKLCIKLEGHIQYYGVSYNIKRIETFLHHTKQIMFKWLNRRSQRKSFNWKKFQLFLLANPLPKARVIHTLF